MNDLVQERIAKPKSDNMSMDEILASIRKIIASDDDNAYVKQSNSFVSSEDTQARLNREKLDKSLSAREQLVSLTKPDLYPSGSHHDSDRTPNSADKSFRINDKNTSDSHNNQRSIYEKLSKHNESEKSNNQYHSHSGNQNQNNDHDEEILRALNEIRNTLSSAATYSVPRDELEIVEKNIPTSEKTQLTQLENEAIKKYLDAQQLKIGNKVIDATAINNSNDAMRDIDLKPIQFSGDAVPEFLKKFKKQQVQDREKTHNQAYAGVKNNGHYDLKSLPNFDEVNEIVTLTEKIMPTTRENLKRQEQKESSVKNNFSKLRQGTEEIMRRATERRGDDNYDLSEEDSPMTAVIIRTLQPMLQEWIDKNIQLIAEQVLREEFRRGLK